MLSATIIVSGASAWMAPCHDPRPVLLDEADFDGGLDGSLGPDALRPAVEGALPEWIVSSRMKRAGHADDDPTIIAPLAEVG